MILKLTKTTAWVEVSITELLAVGMFVALPSIHTGIQAIGQLEKFCGGDFLNHQTAGIANVMSYRRMQIVWY